MVALGIVLHWVLCSSVALQSWQENLVWTNQIFQENWFLLMITRWAYVWRKVFDYKTDDAGAEFMVSCTEIQCSIEMQQFQKF